MLIKKILKKLIKFLSFLFTNFLKRFGVGRYFLEQLNKSINNLNINIEELNKIELPNNYYKLTKKDWEYIYDIDDIKNYDQS